MDAPLLIGGDTLLNLAVRPPISADRPLEAALHFAAGDGLDPTRYVVIHRSDEQPDSFLARCPGVRDQVRRELASRGIQGVVVPLPVLYRADHERDWGACGGLAETYEVCEAACEAAIRRCREEHAVEVRSGRMRLRIERSEHDFPEDSLQVDCGSSAARSAPFEGTAGTDCVRALGSIIRRVFGAAGSPYMVVERWEEGRGSYDDEIGGRETCDMGGGDTVLHLPDCR